MEKIIIGHLLTKRKLLKRIGIMFRNIKKNNPDIQSMESEIKIKIAGKTEEKDKEVLFEFSTDFKNYSINGKVIFHHNALEVEYEIKPISNIKYLIPFTRYFENQLSIYFMTKRIERIFREGSKGLFIF